MTPWETIVCIDMLKWRKSAFGLELNVLRMSLIGNNRMWTTFRCWGKHISSIAIAKVSSCGIFVYCNLDEVYNVVRTTYAAIIKWSVDKIPIYTYVTSTWKRTNQNQGQSRAIMQTNSIILYCSDFLYHIRIFQI